MPFRFNNDVDVKAHHGNIKDKQFGFSYMQQFDVVFNALDNVGTDLWCLSVSDVRLLLIRCTGDGCRGKKARQ